MALCDTRYMNGPCQDLGVLERLRVSLFLAFCSFFSFLPAFLVWLFHSPSSGKLTERSGPDGGLSYARAKAVPDAQHRGTFKLDRPEARTQRLLLAAHRTWEEAVECKSGGTVAQRTAGGASIPGSRGLCFETAAPQTGNRPQRAQKLPVVRKPVHGLKRATRGLALPLPGCVVTSIKWR